MPETTQSEPEQVLLQLPLGDVVRLQALLLYAKSERDEEIIEGWSDKLVDRIQQQAELGVDDVAAFDDDVDRIIEEQGDFDFDDVETQNADPEM